MPDELLDTLNAAADAAADAVGCADRDPTGLKPEQYGFDLAADAAAAAVLAAAGLRVLSEETGFAGSGDTVAVLDPVDGSTNAARWLVPNCRIPGFTVTKPQVRDLRVAPKSHLTPAT